MAGRKDGVYCIDLLGIFYKGILVPSLLVAPGCAPQAFRCGMAGGCAGALGSEEFVLSPDESTTFEIPLRMVKSLRRRWQALTNAIVVVRRENDVRGRRMIIPVVDIGKRKCRTCMNQS
jgi:hypothetical protein